MTTTCPHLDGLARLQAPRLSQAVHREECTQCFDNQDSPAGVDVCLSCFNGGCLSTDRHHAQTHVRKSGHGFTLNVKRKAKPNVKRTEDEEPPAKMTKLAIVEEREEDKYDTTTIIKCWKCDPAKGLELPQVAAEPQVKSLVDSVIKSLSSARQSEVQAWEEEITPCEHTLMLEQFQTGHIAQSGLAHCNACDLKENLWLCLTCGSLGCGRQLYGGLGGNGHGLEHFKSTGHAVSVKLGTITAEGAADIYCYSCDDAKQDPELAAHLSTFGINVQTLTKTEKSMTELQIEHNLRYDFSLLAEDGQALQPARYYPGTADGAWTVKHAEGCDVQLPAECVECQMRKVADGLLSGRYSHPANFSPGSPLGSPTLGSGSPTGVSPQESHQHPSPTPVFQTGIRPVGFKGLVGKGHEEFSTMRQQDSEEFLGHLLNVVRRDLKKYNGREGDPTTVFTYALEQRLQCNECKKVRYRTDENDVVSVAVPAKESGKDADGKTLYEEVQLWTCLDGLLGTEALEYACPGCQKSVLALKQTKFASFPQVLVIHAKKFQLVNWVPAKLDIPIALPSNDTLQFTETHLGTGLKPGEEELADDSSSSSAPQAPQFNEDALNQLQGMGFPLVRCQKALLATGNGADVESAMEWLFGHMDDPDIDAPIELKAASGGGGGGKAEPNPEQVAMLADMGFTHAQAKKALRETNGDAERAVEWLFSHPDDTGEDAPSTSSASGGEATKKEVPGIKEVPVTYKLKAFISHKGPSVHSGHYVAHIRVPNLNSVAGDDEDSWVLFNDEKVVKADRESVRELKKLAYFFTHDFDTPVYKGKTSFETGLFINGKFVDGSEGKTIDIVNPATGKVITSVSEGTAKDVDIAVATAQEAYEKSWGLSVPGRERSNILWKLAELMEAHAKELGAIEALNNGKTFGWASTVDVVFSIDVTKYYAGWADKVTGQVLETNDKTLSYTRHEPIGVVGQIIPSLATGNTVVLKPSEFTPLSALRVCALLNEAGVPPGVVNVVTGYGNTVSEAITSHSQIEKVAFTGSTLVGRKVMEAAAKSNLKKVTLELGGKSPNIIFNDADLEQAVKWTAHGLFWNHGQACCAGSRIFVQSGVYDEFLEKFTAKAKEIKLGDPFGEGVDQGPQISQIQYDRIMGYINSGLTDGAKIHLGGRRVGTDGYFIEPTIFVDANPGMKIVQEEIFGPVGVIIKFENEEDVIRQANDTFYGLAAAVFSKDLNRAINTANKIKAGTVWVNCYNTFYPTVPFGGFKQSGIGRELGEYCLHNYTNVKAVQVNLGTKL
ncbi:hypothetical protein H1R20_g14933, partial [Candolleomyces eurysporus]